MSTRPAWALRMMREREARGWSQGRAVANLRATHVQMEGKEGGSEASLLRQWKEWESGRVKPQHWARYIAATFGTVADDLFPVEARPDQELIASAGMDTAELLARLRASSVDDTTLTAVRLTTDRLCTEYRYRPTHDLRLEGQDWLRRIIRLLGNRLTYKQHGEVLSVAARLALLVGCVEYDSGQSIPAETTRQFARDLGLEIDDPEIIGWAHEMAAWFALTSGDYQRTVAEAEAGIKAAGPRGVSVQLAAQAAKGWARLGNTRNMEVALDRGRHILENLPPPTNPDHHFVIDPAKWHFYEMDAYRAIGDDSLAFIYAQEVLRNGIAETGEERSPMRNAEARVTLGVISARSGSIEEAVSFGQQALVGARRSLPSLVMVGKELAHEFWRTHHEHDPRVRDFRADLAAAAANL